MMINQFSDKTNLEKYLELSKNYFIDGSCSSDKNSVEVICKKHGKIKIGKGKLLYALKKTKIENKIHKICDKCDLESRNITITHPELMEEWDLEKNEIDPKNATNGIRKKIHWKCKKCENSFCCTINAKLLLQNGCPHCSIQNSSTRSKIEKIIFFFIKKVFKNCQNNQLLYYNKKNKKKIYYDMIILDLEPNLIIEYDGYYFHKDKIDFDKKRTKYIKKQGFKILRIRETPLSFINNDNIEYEYTSFRIKKFERVINELLKNIFEWIKKNYSLNKETLNRIDFVISESKKNQLEIQNIINERSETKSAEELYPELKRFWDFEKNILPFNKIPNNSPDKYIWKCSCGNSYKKLLKTQIKKNKNSKDIQCNFCENVKNHTEKNIFLKRYLEKVDQSSTKIILDMKKYNHKYLINCSYCKTEQKVGMYILNSSIKKYNDFFCIQCKKYIEFEKMVNELPKSK